MNDPMFITFIIINTFLCLKSQTLDINLHITVKDDDGFMSVSCSGGKMYGNITKVLVTRQQPGYTYSMCYCSFRGTYNYTSTPITIQNGAEPMYDLGPDDLLLVDLKPNDPTEEVKISVGDEEMRKTLALKLLPGDALLDMICSDDGREIFSEPQLVYLTSDDDHNDDNNSQDGGLAFHWILLIIILCIVVVLIVLIIVIVLVVRHFKKKKANKHSGVERESGDGVTYAAIDPDSMAKPGSIEENKEQGIPDLDPNREPLNYSEMDFEDKKYVNT